MNEIDSQPIAVTDPDDWRWRDHRGRVWTIHTLKDDHLVAIELFLTGRAPDFKLHPDYQPGNPNWDKSYAIVRDEVERRGLSLIYSEGGIR